MLLDTLTLFNLTDEEVINNYKKAKRAYKNRPLLSNYNEEELNYEN